MGYQSLLKSFLILRKKNIGLYKGKPSENPFNIAKNQESELNASRHFKNLISSKPVWNSQSMESNFFEKFKAIA